MRKEMVTNKKAQEMSITTLILLALGVVVLIVVILGFTQGFGIVTKYFEKADTIEREAVIQVCGGIASFSESACNTKYELSKDRYITCSYAVKNLNVSFDGSSELEKCDTIADAKSVCVFEKAKVDETKFDDTLVVNGKTCADLGVAKTPAKKTE